MSLPLNLYEQLADELGALIADRVFVPGDRLPSVRHLAQQKRLSISTVMQALRLLEDRGLVDAKPQAGFFVRARPRALASPPIAANLEAPRFVGINNRLMRVLQVNETLGSVQLGAAWPQDDLLPVKRIQQIVGTLSRRRPELLGEVTCTRTNEPTFTRQIIRRAVDWGKLDPAEIVVTASCTEAISLALRAVAKAGDTVAVESPTYFLLLQVIESMGMKALEIPTHPRTGLSIDALELAMGAGLVDACLFLPNSNNPLGSVMPEENKKRLAALLALHDIPLIEDDIYGDLCFATERPWPVKAYDTSGNVLLCSSFSKAISPAMRVGYIAAGKYAQEVQLMKALSSGVTSHFFQAVLAEYIDGGSYDNQLRKMRRTLMQRIAQMSDAVQRYFPAECSISEPQGGIVVWIRMPENVDALALHEHAALKGIASMPGPLFSSSGKFQNYIRLNCGNVWSPTIEAAVRTLGMLAHEAADGALDPVIGAGGANAAPPTKERLRLVG
ncbi:MAG TPA: PLP-dependent aminotransferase family protein [Burkholderiaceae bacterium]|jgi:DNA-binding transcriptional MocR family regulator